MVFHPSTLSDLAHVLSLTCIPQPMYDTLTTWAPVA